MGIYVKNTMLETAIGMIAPHHCYGCGITGPLLCRSCKYDIVSESFSGCIQCGKLARDGICYTCKTAYQHAWCVGERDDILKQVIDGYKFSRKKASYKILAELLDDIVPMLPRDTILVSVPTQSAHVRQRGYDHTQLIARELARLRKLVYRPLLSREHQLVQRGSTKVQRHQQASTAFRVHQHIDPEPPYLLIDDIVTTGATVKFAAQALQKSGAKIIMVAAIARQPLK